MEDAIVSESGDASDGIQSDKRDLAEEPGDYGREDTIVSASSSESDSDSPKKWPLKSEKRQVIIFRDLLYNPYFSSQF